ncbi:MAG TPA: type VI secretion system tube protein Hcp [Stellaceae bacterium]|nr:type VI secretion system tube protein Hcp [Stellaceae bacterium]
MAIYMKYGSIPGSVTTSGFEKWTELTSFQWGVRRGVGSPTSTGLSREATEPTLSEVVVTKEMDVSAPKMFLEGVAGLLNNTVLIKFTTTTKNTVVTFLTYELDNTCVSSYSISSGGDLPMESITLNFTKIIKTFTGMDPGVSGSPESVGYDLAIRKTT